MKNILRRLNLSGNSEDPPDGGHTNSVSVKSKLSASESARHVAASSEPKAFHGLSGLLTAAKNTLSQAGSIRHRKGDSLDTSNVCKREELGSGGSASTRGSQQRSSEHSDKTVEEDRQLFMADSVPTLDRRSSDCMLAPPTAGGASKGSLGIVNLERAQTAETAALRRASDQALILQDEELQVRVAMAISVRDDPEAAAIETAKDLSLGSDRLLSNSTANLLAYRYWKYNILTYDENVVDGFYDACAVVSDVSFETMPSLSELQETPVSDQILWDAVLVNRATDNGLVRLQQKASSLALSYKSDPGGRWKENGVYYRLAVMVADQMGGPVADPDLHIKKWRLHVANLRLSLGNAVLPLGHLQVGLARHRGLLYKVLADAVGMPCQLVKGIKYMGGDEAAVNIIKMDGGREYIIDLMAAPGTLLPYDTSMIPGSKSSLPLSGKEALPLPQVDHKVDKLTDKVMAAESMDLSSPKTDEETKGRFPGARKSQKEHTELKEWHAMPAHHHTSRSSTHRRSPSWTEGIGSPAVQDMKVKDVSQYMMNAAKENPALAQKLHDVLLESGVQAPLDLFNEISPMHLQAQEWKVADDIHRAQIAKGDDVRRKQKGSVGPGRPPIGPSYSSSSEDGGKERLRRLNSVEGLGERRPLDLGFLSQSPSSSPNSSASSGAAVAQSSSPVLPAATALSLVHENLPPELIKRVPVAAAAAATAAVVASSMVVAAAKTELVSDPTLDVPVAAAATATAAVVVATSAVVGRRLELPIPEPIKEVVAETGSNEARDRSNGEASVQNRSPRESGPECQASGGTDKLVEDERVSDKSTGSVSAKSDRALDDVAECEIPWEELVIGERIGLGSYGEVYHADWHGTEVAVKKFLDQDITGDALIEFGSEVRLMKRMRHPNVVLFMGAVMRPPNLSIVTEFLPRGSLYRLLHRSSSQLDERRRMRMALDVARGMNYLHSSTPVIVHRDLKSPNLLVDKNWVVKVCDFGLSRMKHNTFLSSKSTAGTPEWMAPEVLRNEPSNEKSDVYSFGVILWELATLQQPWGGMNPMQVVGAVGFQHRTLDIPDNLDPLLVKIIHQCWHSDPSLRPSFADIMGALKPLQQPVIQSQVPKG